MRILIVDDDRITRLFLKTFLIKSGHSILESSNGEEAIKVFEAEKPELILMDVTMPVMSGYDAATIIKQRCGNRFVPIIFLTALSDDESLAQCVASGGDDFLAKPVNKILLGAKITAMQRIRRMNQELEHYKMRTEEEIELTHHVFDSLTKRMSAQTVPELDYWRLSAGHFSGDLMIYDKSSSGKLYLLLADFTGHGFSAAIGALPTSDIFFAMTRREFNAVDILTEINRKLHDIMPTSHFCAAVFICFAPKTRRIEVFNGGLPPVLILDAAGHIQASVKSSNLSLGILSAGAFNAEIATFENILNNTLALYSDGVIEARNCADEM
ncbi:MAG: fused response regulator/phosphatase, partial [Methylomonas sp.]